jgi:F-type H+-transporting ATPase subunit gamma
MGNKQLPKEKVVIYAAGSKARDSLSRKGYQIAEDYSEIMDNPTYHDATVTCNAVLKAFLGGEIGEIYLAYTHFRNTVSQIPTLVKLLPVDADHLDEEGTEPDDGLKAPMNFEPDEESVLDMIVPKYLTSLFYGAFVESVASENGARMRAMDSATKNADDMIDALALKYNRARQSSITQELTEIIAGAEAIS